MLASAMTAELAAMSREDASSTALSVLLPERVMDVMRRVDRLTGASLAARYAPMPFNGPAGILVGWRPSSLDWDCDVDGVLMLEELAPFPGDDDPLVEAAMSDLSAREDTRPFSRRYRGRRA